MTQNEMRKVILNLRLNQNIKILHPKKDGCFNVYYENDGKLWRISTLEKDSFGRYFVKFYPYIDFDANVSVRKEEYATYKSSFNSPTILDMEALISVTYSELLSLTIDSIKYQLTKNFKNSL